MLLRLSQHPGNRHGIEPISLGSQALPLMKLMCLPRMHQAELIASLLQLVIEVLTVACRRLHSNEDFSRERIQPHEFVQ